MVPNNLLSTPFEKNSWLDRPLWKRFTPALLLLLGIMLISTILHFMNLRDIGNANSYYLAAVKSMLGSWHNFFFAAAEPGGSVTVDKPPLGLWIEAAFAFVWGVSGIVVSLPNILAGIFGLPLLYHLVKKYLGTLAGLVAALVYAVTPVVVAADRNNTMDGMLVFTLLLATWMFIKATETGKLRWLLLGAFLVGLGFNIKSMQVLLPLPALYALFFFGSKIKWNRKLIYLILATLVLLVVSLSWFVAVDLTPADQRPFVGGSTANSELELILGYNGLGRFLGKQGGTQILGDLFQNDTTGKSPLSNGWLTFLTGNNKARSEIGVISPKRFFEPPLAVQMSWLLPFALITLVLVAATSRLQWPFSNEHKVAILWGGWLLTCLVFFSFARTFHAYYLIMLAPALGGTVGAGFTTIWEKRDQSWVRWSGLAAVLITVIFQFWLALNYYPKSWLWLSFAIALTLVGCLGLVTKRRKSVKAIYSVAYTCLLAGMLITPLAWSALTVLNRPQDLLLPSAYRYRNYQTTTSDPVPGSGLPAEQSAMLSYLEANTKDIRYLVAIPTGKDGAEWVLATGRPVLYMGGFGGMDPVVYASDLEAMVKNRELRYILMIRTQDLETEIPTWVRANCDQLPEFSSNQTVILDKNWINGQATEQLEFSTTLYDCSP